MALALAKITAVWNPAAMPTAFALLLAAKAFVPAEDLPLDLHGECIYPPNVVEAAVNDTLVLCDGVAADGQGITFRQSQWDAGTRFFGTWRGTELQVTAVQARTGDPVEARGQCRIFFANGEVSMVSCTAVRGGRGWAANFRNVRP